MRKKSEFLTPREEEILALIARGLSNVEISKELFITPKTVKNHVQNLFPKLKVRNRVEAANYYYERGKNK